MHPEGYPEVLLPAFVPSTAPPACSSIADVTKLLEGEGAAMVVVNGIEQLPLRVLEAAVERNLRLLVVLQPGRGVVPELLEKVQIEAATRPADCAVRVLASPWGERHHDLVLLTEEPVERGSGHRLAFGAGTPTQAGRTACQVALEPPGALAYDAFAWFQDLWTNAAPLTPEVAAAYPEWPQSSTSQFADEWDVYRQTLQDFARAGSQDEADAEADDPEMPSRADDEFLLEFDALAEEPAENGADEGRPDSGAQRSSVLVVRQPSELDREISALYGRGAFVTVHSAKLRAYRLDVTEALGLEPKRKWGRASATNAVRLNLLTTEVRPGVEKLRGEAKQILKWHAFSLDDNQYWMPLAAESHFEGQLKAIVAIDNLATLLGTDIDKYVEHEINNFLESLHEVLDDRNKAPFVFTDKIVSSLKVGVSSYLKANSQIGTRPTYSTEVLHPRSDQSASYARPFNLLASAVDVTRTRLAYLDSGAQRETEGPPLSTLDVLGGGDGLLHRQRNRTVGNIARRQLDELKAYATRVPRRARA